MNKTVWAAGILLIILVLSAPFISRLATDYAGAVDPLTTLYKASYTAIQYAGMIELPKLSAMEESWGNSYVLTHDFNRQGLSGWKGRLGDHELASIPQQLEVEYYMSIPYKRNALLMHAEQSAVVLAKTWNIDSSDIEYVRMVSYALATRTDCEGNVSVHAGFYYVGQSMGAITSTGGLTYQSLLPHIVNNGSNWILSKPSGVLEVYSPAGAQSIKVDRVSIYKAPANTYIIDGRPYKVTGKPIEAVVKQANGGVHTWPAKALDGLVTAVIPGNPLLVTPLKPVKGALLLDLAPGYSRLPSILELYKLSGDSWVKVNSTIVVPTGGRIGFLVEAWPGDVLMLKSTVTVRVDRIYFSPVEKLDPGGLEAIRGVMVSRVNDGVRITYDARGYEGPVLLRIDAQVGGGPTLYTGGGGLTVYGKLWIMNPSGAPYIDQCAWVTISSDIVEVPGGMEIVESGIILIGYRYPGGPDSPLMTLYVKTLLYPIVASAGYPDNKYDIAYHTEAVVGISRTRYETSLDLYGHDQYDIGVSVSALRTSIAGENYWGRLLDVPDINITLGKIGYEGTDGCEPPNDGHIVYSFGVNTVESTAPGGSSGYSGFSTALSVISVLGGFTSIVLSIVGYGAPATIVSAVSLASGLFDGVANVTHGATDIGFLRRKELVNLPCTHFNGTYVITDYGFFDDYTHVVMSYLGSYNIVTPSQYGVLIGAVVFNYYVYGDYWATDEDAIVVLLYFIKPYGSS